MRKTLTCALVVALAPPMAMAAGTHSGGHGDEMAIGAPAEGPPQEVVRVTMTETDDGRMIFEPAAIDVAEGETVRLIITNEGMQEHEFVMDTPEEIAEHKEVMARFPEMEHDDPNAVRLGPGESGEILWTFSNAGAFEYACLMLGHYEAGMHGPLTVN